MRGRYRIVGALQGKRSTHFTFVILKYGKRFLVEDVVLESSSPSRFERELRRWKRKEEKKAKVRADSDFWVECASCKKWRPLLRLDEDEKKRISSDAFDWECSMHPDFQHLTPSQSCSQSQDWWWEDRWEADSDTNEETCSGNS